MSASNCLEHLPHAQRLRDLVTAYASGNLHKYVHGGSILQRNRHAGRSRTGRCTRGACTCRSYGRSKWECHELLTKLLRRGRLASSHSCLFLFRPCLFLFLHACPCRNSCHMELRALLKLLAWAAGDASHHYAPWQNARHCPTDVHPQWFGSRPSLGPRQ